VDDILERDRGSSNAIGWSDLQGVVVHTIGSGDHCTGLYVVGATAGLRALSGKEDGLRRLLVQATGRPRATIRVRDQSPRVHLVSRWSEGSTPVTARWNGSTLMELRIGDATP